MTLEEKLLTALQVAGTIVISENQDVVCSIKIADFTEHHTATGATPEKALTSFLGLVRSDLVKLAEHHEAKAIAHSEDAAKAKHRAAQIEK
jgi:predicted mannosyl-3-phosphoglycerate phosphatase (HAD superfamily)